MAGREVFGPISIVAILFGIVIPGVFAQAQGPAPAPTSDGASIDQGIAYALMLVALVLTYLIHPLDASKSYIFF
ncbi:arabinogalactan protein 20 [Zostera marina]|uniref:Arabinogalactan protein 20 n=1 Tax=Zostera marina TaxID=29655 RepID=A0A0K9PWE7_ZOSMR|nr:arabinogalactan protein 20 [Zostera marina]